MTSCRAPADPHVYMFCIWIENTPEFEGLYCVLDSITVLLLELLRNNSCGGLTTPNIAGGRLWEPVGCVCVCVCVY